MKVGLISCCGPKLTRPAPARELYTSSLFVKSLDLATRRCDHVYVISALHGLLDLDHVTKPYDFTMKERSKSERTHWGKQIASKLVDRYGDAFDVEIYAGIDYASPVRMALRTYKGHGKRVGRDDGWRGLDGEIVEPMAGMMVGERLRWLKRELETRASA